MACCDLRSFWNSKFNFFAEVVYFAVCFLNLNFNGDLLRFQVILEPKFDFLSEMMYFSVCLGDLKFNGGLLRFKVNLEMEIRLSFRNHVLFGIPSGSDIQRWLVAI